MIVALTFDDGPSVWTSAILDELARDGDRATFFVLGVHLEGHEDVLRRMVVEGHEIGMHGWDHTRLDDLDRAALTEQIERSRRAIQSAAGVTPTLWRSPWHRTTKQAHKVLRKSGLTLCPADLDAADMRLSPEQIVGVTIAGLQNGLVIGLHDGVAPNGKDPDGSREATVLALPRILDYCRSVTVSELRGH